MYGSVRVSLIVVPQLRPGLDVVYHGQHVQVAPLDDIPQLRLRHLRQQRLA